LPPTRSALYWTLLSVRGLSDNGKCSLLRPPKNLTTASGRGNPKAVLDAMYNQLLAWISLSFPLRSSEVSAAASRTASVKKNQPYAMPVPIGKKISPAAADQMTVVVFVSHNSNDEDVFVLAVDEIHPPGVGGPGREELDWLELGDESGAKYAAQLHMYGGFGEKEAALTAAAAAAAAAAAGVAGAAAVAGAAVAGAAAPEALMPLLLEIGKRKEELGDAEREEAAATSATAVARKGLQDAFDVYIGAVGGGGGVGVGGQSGAGGRAGAIDPVKKRGRGPGKDEDKTKKKKKKGQQ
jgi:hypothetical protein